MEKTLHILRNNMQRGFIQIPILIMILIGIATIGGTGYVAYEVGQKSSRNVPAPVATTTANIQAQSMTTAATSTPKQIEAKEIAPAKTPRATASAPTVSSNVATNYCNGRTFTTCSLPKIFNCPKDGGEGQCVDPATNIYCATDGAYYQKSVCPSGQVLNCPTDGGQIRCIDRSKSAYCNGAYYNPCTSGYFVCPVVGKATCAIDNSSQTLESLAKQLEYLNEQQKQSEANRQQALQELAQQFQEKYKPCDDWSKQIDANVVAIKAEISAAGGFGTESQVLAMAIKRAGNPPAQCGGFSSGYVSSYSSTHCNYLNGGLDCTSSDGTRMQATPIPGGSGFNISSW